MIYVKWFYSCLAIFGRGKWGKFVWGMTENGIFREWTKTNFNEGLGEMGNLKVGGRTDNFLG